MSRRGAGEGSVYQRKDGRWTCELNWTLPSGEGVRRQRYAATRREAQAKLKDLRAERDAGLSPQSTRLTVAQYLERYLRDVVDVQHAPHTQSHVRSVVRTHAVPAFGTVRLQQLGALQLQALYADLLRAGREPSTVRQIHATLRAALNQAVAWGLLAKNPCVGVRLPRPSTAERRILTPSEATTLLEAVAGDRWEAMVWLALCCGLREGEVFGLHWADVAAGHLVVRHSWGRGGLGPTKGRHLRQVPLPAEVADALERRRVGWPTAPRIFLDVSISHWYRTWWQPLTQRLGLGGLHFHDLRHTCGSQWLVRGVPLANVSRLLGHASVGITASVYVHQIEGADRAGVDAWAGELGGSDGSRAGSDTETGLGAGHGER